MMACERSGGQAGAGEVTKGNGYSGAPLSLWRGTIYLGPGWLVYAGSVGPVDRHRHWAIQVLVALSGWFVLRDDGGREVRCARAVVPANVVHSTARGDPGCAAALSGS